MSGVASRRSDLAVLGGLALYFAAQTALRAGLGGGLEVDEGEMLVLARGWAWGYGPQFPLYNWLQVAGFALFGPTTLALAAVKNLVLFLAWAGLFLGLRRVLPFWPALCGGLALAFMPNVIWEFQRASTHSIALLAAVTWTIWAILGVIARGRTRDWVALGVMLGLGGLTKANFWLVPLAFALAAWRMPGLPPVDWRRAGWAVAVAGLILARPYLWMLQNRDMALASTRKMYEPGESLPFGLEGLAEAAVGAVAGLALVGLVAFVLSGRGRGAVDDGPDWPGRLMIRAGGIGLGLSALAIVAAGMQEVQARWLVPALVPLAAGLMVQAARRASPLALRRLPWVAAGLGLVTLAGMAELRVRGPSTGGIDYRPLAELVDEVAPDVVLANFQLGGNLVLLRPDLKVIAPSPRVEPGSKVRVLVVLPGTEAREGERLLRPWRMQPSAPVAGEPPVVLELPYRNAPGEAFEVTAVLLPSLSWTADPR